MKEDSFSESGLVALSATRLRCVRENQFRTAARERIALVRED